MRILNTYTADTVSILDWIPVVQDSTRGKI